MMFFSSFYFFTITFRCVKLLPKQEEGRGNKGSRRVKACLEPQVILFFLLVDERARDIQWKWPPRDHDAQPTNHLTKGSNGGRGPKRNSVSSLAFVPFGMFFYFLFLDSDNGE